MNKEENIKELKKILGEACCGDFGYNGQSAWTCINDNILIEKVLTLIEKNETKKD